MKSGKNFNSHQNSIIFIQTLLEKSNFIRSQSCLSKRAISSIKLRFGNVANLSNIAQRTLNCSILPPQSNLRHVNFENMKIYGKFFDLRVGIRSP